MKIRLIIEMVEEGVDGGQRGERVVDLPTVPRIGESVWVAKRLALRVSGVSWLWQSDATTPHVFFEAFEDSGSGVEQFDKLTLKIPSYLVKDLRESGWDIEAS
jgi:hypothetical protein